MDTFRNDSIRNNGLKHFQKDDRGLSTVEYVIILVIIAVTAISAWKKFGGAVTDQIKKSNTQIENL